MRQLRYHKSMKKILPFILLLSLTSCSKSQEYITFNSPYSIPSDDSRVTINEREYISPFNTSLTLSVYSYSGTYSKKDYTSMEEDFDFYTEYYHALSDRHYHYSLDEKKINNVKVINESYGNDTWIDVDPFLYELLKKNYDFSILTSGKYNMFLGSINQIYEDHDNETALDYVFTKASGFSFSSFTIEEREKIAEYSNNMPTSSEIKSLLSFDEENNRVKFNSLYRDGKLIENLEISLSASAKGYATEKIASIFKEKYPGISMIINSGHSSIKAVGIRPDKKNWNINFDNPLYELYSGRKNIYDDNEFTISYQGEFTLSTSGNYLNSFYEYYDGKIKRRNHIIDPYTGYSANYLDSVSVFLDDALLVDMMTTCLMTSNNQDEFDSFISLFEKEYNLSNIQYMYSYEVVDDNRHILNLSDFDILSDNNLPISVLGDSNVYTGDYSDIKTNDIKSVMTQLNVSLDMVYYVTPSLFEMSSVKDSSKLKRI